MGSMTEKQRCLLRPLNCPLKRDESWCESIGLRCKLVKQMLQPFLTLQEVLVYQYAEFY